ncbi:hypothetical protein MXB_3370 [Myxobolus squamalis]|nr:hypothetical protein MXB_3370 [Myxobolus squamalis]
MSSNNVFRNDLCSCCQSRGHCGYFLLSCCCPCIMSYFIAKKMDMSTIISAGFFVLGCFYSVVPAIYFNNKVREQRGIEGNLCIDIVVGFFCTPCALMRARMELDVPGVINRE